MTFENNFPDHPHPFGGDSPKFTEVEHNLIEELDRAKLRAKNFEMAWRICLEALGKVRELHQEDLFNPSEHFYRGKDEQILVCKHCTDTLIENDTEGGYAGVMYQPYPCPTIQAIEGVSNE